jgi:hypothetical protein
MFFSEGCCDIRPRAGRRSAWRLHQAFRHDRRGSRKVSSERSRISRWEPYTLGLVPDPGKFCFDTDAWPLVVLRCPARIDETSLAPLIDHFEACHAHRRRFALVVDATATQSMPSAKWRRGLTDWANDPRVLAETRRYSVGTSLLIASPLARGVYTALLWLWKPPTPHYVTATMSAGVEWCCQRLTHASVPLGPALEAQRALLAPGR